MARRIVSFKNFRNIGLEDNQNNYIILNQNLEKGKMGDVVELIGANNSGKSNVLDGIVALTYGKTAERDITTLSFKDTDRKPEVTLTIQNGNDFSKKITLDGVLYYSDYKDFKNIKFEKQKLIDLMGTIASLYANCLYRYGILSNEIDGYSSNRISQEKVISKLNAIREEIDRNYLNDPNWRSVRQQLQQSLLYKIGPKKQIDDYCKENFGLSIDANIIRYKEEMISRNDMVSSINDLANNKFFISVFKAIGIDVSEILNAFKQYQEFANPASLDKIRKTIDKKIQKLNKQFNKLYFAENDQYKFSINIESTQIGFGMARGKDEDPIMIEQQSTGFRWFFNLYFNFLCSNKLNPGDIIIMDEPATNLHPEGQKELRRFIKEYAISNDLTFIIATHSPFLVDTDNYDELRIVTMENNRSSINNLFTAVNDEDPDTLIPVKESLTIKQNVLYDLDTEVIWVEGLTDYCYLTAFKNMFGIKNIAFVPFNGVGKTDAIQDNILKKIVSTKFFKRSILLDGDTLGKSMAKKCENTVFKDRVYMIPDVGGAFIEIEDLFSENDKNKFEIIKKDEIQKKASIASSLKKFARLEDFSEETINNFKSLFQLFE